MKLTALLEQISGLELASGQAHGVEVSTVTFDSRQVGPGALFVALEGSRADGHRYVEAAAQAGAAAVLVNRDRLPFEVDCPVLSAEDTRQILGRVGAAFYDSPSDKMRVVGVTGTNGKTTTTWILDGLFRAADSNGGLLGTIAYRWGRHEQPAVNTTPESLVVHELLERMRRDGVSRVAMEVSSHGLATHRLGGVHFDAAIFTNLTQDHLDFHGDMTAYRDAKARLFDALLPEAAAAGKTPTAIINADDPNGAWFAEQARSRGVHTVTFGLHGPADWRATDVVQTLDGARFVVDGPHERFAVESALLGEFNVSNVLAAVVAARAVGVPVEAIRDGLRGLESVPGRMQRVESDAGPAVFVDYAHTPDAIARALATVRPLASGRLFIVFGCGGDRDRDKRAPMTRYACEGADLAVLTSDNPRSEDPGRIIEEMRGGIPAGEPTLSEADELAEAPRGAWIEANRGRAIDAAIAAAGEADVVLIAGKGHETYQEINGERLPFDDAQRARAALEARAQAPPQTPHSDDMAQKTTAHPANGERRIRRWTLAKIAEAAGGRLEGAAVDQHVSRVCSDTRSLRPGELFVALRGENFDAHDFLDQAEAAGAAAVMVDRTDGVETTLPRLVVDDTLAGLTRLGHAVWREATEAGLHTIDVTGSNGKTTVKEMLALLWGAHGEAFATPGNLNNHIGVPLVLCDLPAECEHLMAEMGANGPGDISHLIAMAPGSERIITSIGMAHIEGFGSLDGVRRTKSEIFEGADAQTTAIVPFSEVDNLIGDDFPGRVITVGFEEEADLSVRLLEASGQGGEALRFEVRHGDDRLELRLPLPGKHHALNAATSLATMIARGVVPDQDLCNRRLSHLALPKGRWRVVDVGDVRMIDDAYNANPSSVTASFDAFMETPDPEERPRVAVIGEMFELGDDAEAMHREVAATVASRADLDAFVAVGPYAAQMVEAARTNAAGQLEAVGFETVEQTADWLARRGPAFVLLKASRGARLERVVDLVAAKGENRRATKS